MFFNNEPMININNVCNYKYNYEYNRYTYDENNYICYIEKLDDYNILNYKFDINLILFFLMIIFTGLSISTIIVSYIVYKPLKDNFDNNTQNNLSYDPFLLSYIDEYYLLNNIEINVEDKCDIKDKYVIQTFKYNNKEIVIIMSYDNEDDKNQFIYYTNYNSLPYDYLDTVARIFSVAYKLKNIYIDRYDIKEENNINEENENIEEDLNNKINKVFYKKNKSNKNQNILKDKQINKIVLKGDLNDFKQKFKYYNIFINDKLVEIFNYENSNLFIKYKDNENDNIYINIEDNTINKMFLIYNKNKEYENLKNISYKDYQNITN